MPLIYSNESIFNSQADIITNPVNCVGVMGAGLALEFKKRYLDMFEAYKLLCENKSLKPGNPNLYYSNTKKILLFPTKNHFINLSKIEWIDEGLKDVSSWLGRRKNCNSIAFPKLGCGYGGLNWNDVEKLFIKHFSNNEHNIYIHI